MKITPDLFHAYLKCPTKCWLRATCEPPSGNTYAEWVKTQNELYRVAETERVVAGLPSDETATSPKAENLKAAQWRLASSLTAQAQTDSCAIESEIHAVERVPSQGRGKAAQFIPIRFIYRNKLTKDDKLLLTFDAFLLSEALGRDVPLGKIIHGDDHATLKVKLGVRTAESARTPGPAKGLYGEVRKHLEKMAAMLSGHADARSADSHVRESDSGTDGTRGLGGPRSAPDLVLNRHCAECEFRDRCRKIAVEKDDLSLLANMSAKERQKLRGKGIFTVTQLSYTFRPRRRPKRLRDKREKYHHSLKALAIREKKIHIVGSPELKIEGTPVYLDVEGLPDRDFYYLIGLRIGHGDSAVQHSLWADTVADEGKIWREFLDILKTVEKPVLIQYGSYESTFVKTMIERHGTPLEESTVQTMIKSSINIVSVMFGQIYFPTYSNGLKEIGAFLGLEWPTPNASGILTIVWRREAENSSTSEFRQRLVTYNAQDCLVLEKVVGVLAWLGVVTNGTSSGRAETSVVQVASLKPQTLFGKFASPISELEHVNKAARWDYQRDRVYTRSSIQIRRSVRQRKPQLKLLMPINKVVSVPDRSICPDCGTKGFRHRKVTTQVSHDIFFGKANLKRWVVEYRFRYHWCPQCKHRFGRPQNCWRETKFGRNLIAYYLYQLIELQIPRGTIQKSLKRLFGYDLGSSCLGDFKEHSTEFYRPVMQEILARIKRSSFVHVDETKANVRGRTAYVWVFTTLTEVAYLYADSREGEILRATLSGFSGVLVSDFYSVYDAIDCPQQKCLLHLMRDLNTEMLNHPYDEELQLIVRSFAELMKAIVATVDQFGLKKHYLRRHLKSMDSFFEKLAKTNSKSEPAMKCRERFEKNHGKLFTFLNYDCVSWNNNNAEHAIKAFARLRDIIEGSSTQKGLEEYLVLLSVCQTCTYSGLDFLEFLRSGERDIEAFARTRQRRREKARVVLRDADGGFPFARNLQGASIPKAPPGDASSDD